MVKEEHTERRFTYGRECFKKEGVLSALNNADG